MDIKILIADELPLIRAGIQNELEHHLDFKVVGEARRGNEVYFLVNKLKPDVLLLDIKIFGMKAVDRIREIRESNLDLRIVIITSLCDKRTIMEMLQIGVKGYLLKNEDTCLISEAIYKVCEGAIYLCQTILSRIVEGENQHDLGKHTELTNREKDVLNLLRIGKTNKEIAIELSVSKRTVEFHVSNVLKKLGARNRAEAIILTNPKHTYLK